MPSASFSCMVAIVILFGPANVHGQETGEESQETELAKLCETAHYVLVGTVSQCESAGESGPPDGEARHWFYRMEVAHETDLFGELKDRARQAREGAELEPVDQFVVHALLTRTAPLSEQIEPGTRCIVWLRHMRAGAMAGTIPVSMMDIQPADDALVRRVRELIADRADR
ncbi:MAG: hypothetical protein ACR2NP_02615 [Pirellulaceae bacterium]